MIMEYPLQLQSEKGETDSSETFQSEDLLQLEMKLMDTTQNLSTRDDVSKEIQPRRSVAKNQVGVGGWHLKVLENCRCCLMQQIHQSS